MMNLVYIETRAVTISVDIYYGSNRIGRQLYDTRL